MVILHAKVHELYTYKSNWITHPYQNPQAHVFPIWILLNMNMNIWILLYIWIYEYIYIYIEYMNIYLYMYIECIRQLLWIQDVWIICSQVPLRRFLPFYPNPQGVDHLGTHHLFVHICSMNYLAAIHHNRLFIMKMCYKTPYTPYITIIFLWFDSFDSP